MRKKIIISVLIVFLLGIISFIYIQFQKNEKDNKTLNSIIEISYILNKLPDTTNISYYSFIKNEKFKDLSRYLNPQEIDSLKSKIKKLKPREIYGNKLQGFWFNMKNETLISNLNKVQKTAFVYSKKDISESHYFNINGDEEIIEIVKIGNNITKLTYNESKSWR